MISFIAILNNACAPPPARLNAAHLEHLYEAIPKGDTLLGAVWIYCEAPDYHLVGDEDEGFTCVDDVARALVFYCRQYPSDPSPENREKIRSLTAFLLYMQAKNGYFNNFMLPGPRVNTTHRNSEAVAGWWSWRALWALSEVNLLPPEELAGLQAQTRPVIDTLVRKIQALCPVQRDPVVFDGVAVPGCLAELGADQVSVIVMGLANEYRTRPSETLKTLMLSFGDLLLGVQHGDADTPPYFAIMSWRNEWHAWGNSQAYALLYAGRILQHEPFIRAGLNEVRHFYPYCLDQGLISGFKVTLEADSLRVRDLRQFPQIAYNIRPMVYASLEAFAITGDPAYAATAGRLAAWFYGVNPAGLAMYDPATGRTFDGIGSPKEVNRNSGAESTIEALLTLQAVEAVPEARKMLPD